MRQTPDKKVIVWLDKQPRTSVWTTSVTIVEVRFGLQIMPLGKRRSRLIQAFEAVLDKIGYRVAPFDAADAQQAGDLMASPQKKGRPGELRGTLIAGIVLAQHATLATRTANSLKIFRFQSSTRGLCNAWTLLRYLFPLESGGGRKHSATGSAKYRKKSFTTCTSYTTSCVCCTCSL
jgi:predicted nucleic acid-binding protein